MSASATTKMVRPISPARFSRDIVDPIHNTLRATPSSVLVALLVWRQVTRAMFKDSNVLLTGVGAEGQVGEAVAAAFAALGATLILVDRHAENAQARAAAIAPAYGGQAHGYGCDLANAADVASLVDRVRAEHG